MDAADEPTVAEGTADGKGLQPPVSKDYCAAPDEPLDTVALTAPDTTVALTAPGPQEDKAMASPVQGPEPLETRGDGPNQGNAAESSGVEEQQTQPLSGELSVEQVAEISIDDQGVPLGYPSSLFYDPGAEELYVVNGKDGRVLITGPDYIPNISMGAGRGIEVGVAVAVDREGNVYVCQQQTATQAARLTILNAAFFVLRDIIFEQYAGISKEFTPLRVAVSAAGLIYVAGNELGALVFNQEGELLHKLTPVVSEETKKMLFGQQEPTIRDVAIDSRGRIYLLSEEVSQVFIFSETGEQLLSFGEKGGSTGKLSRPRGVAVDEKRGLIYVVDYMRHTILVYNDSGRYLAEFGGLGVGPGWFNYPTDIEVGRQGQVIVADFFNNRVQVLDTKFKTPTFGR